MSISAEKAVSKSAIISQPNYQEIANANSTFPNSFVSWRYRASKRLFDIVGAAAGMLLLAPVFFIAYLAIKLSSPGNPIFVQARWGLNGKLIRIYKFRTMHMDQCDQSGVSQTVLHDKRVTKVGQILRKTNVDELPQLLNVLAGNLSLVGPRCHVPNMLAGGVPYEELVPNYHERHAVKPGITGLAQVRGLRGPTLNAFLAKRRIASDIEYVRNRTIWLDLKIVVKTVVQEIQRASGH